jgi:hypothetical protein
MHDTTRTGGILLPTKIPSTLIFTMASHLFVQLQKCIIVYNFYTILNFIRWVCINSELNLC